jgi:hypothetical protein
LQTLKQGSLLEGLTSLKLKAILLATSPPFLVVIYIIELLLLFFVCELRCVTNIFMLQLGVYFPFAPSWFGLRHWWAALRVLDNYGLSRGPEGRSGERPTSSAIWTSMAAAGASGARLRNMRVNVFFDSGGAWHGVRRCSDVGEVDGGMQPPRPY